MKYEIWVDNGVAVEFESDSDSIGDVLDEFCIDAGYKDHQDACETLGFTENSPFNIVALDEYEPGICGACNGSGEGYDEGTTCRSCKGSGEC